MDHDPTDLTATVNALLEGGLIEVAGMTPEGDMRVRLTDLGREALQGRHSEGSSR